MEFKVHIQKRDGRVVIHTVRADAQGLLIKIADLEPGDTYLGMTQDVKMPDLGEMLDMMKELFG